MISSGVFARGTRSIAVSVNATDGVVQGATLTFSPDDGAVVYSYDLYIAKGDADYGPDLSLWPSPVKLATIAHNVNSYEVSDIGSHLGSWEYARFFLVSSAYAARTDDLKIRDRIVADGNQKLVVTGYKPLGTARFDYEMSLTAMPTKNKYFGIFCARKSDSTPQNTFTSFIHGKDEGGYGWRMDYGGNTLEHDNNLGCAVGTTNWFTAAGTGTSATLGNWVNGQYRTVTTYSEQVLTQAANPLMLFACYGKNVNDGLSWQAKMAMYSFRATETNTVVHNLLPATTNNVPGMYDVVDGKFYTSGTSPSFTAAGIENPELVESSALIKRTQSVQVFRDELSRPFTVNPTYDAQGLATSARFDFDPSDISVTQRVTAVFGSRRVAVTNLPPGAATSFVYDIPLMSSPTCRFEVEPLLPDGYTPLAYVETSASNDNDKRQGCFLDTGYTPRGTTSVKAKVACLPSQNSKGNWTLFCARKNQDAAADNLVLTLFALNSTKFRFDYASIKGADTTSGSFTNGSPFSVECRVPGGCTVTQSDGSSETYYSDRVYANFIAAGPMRLFASYSDGSLQKVGNAEAMRVYDYRIRDIDGEQLTLLPAKNSEGVVGLWDFKSGTFRTSSGTVSFSAGEAASVSAHLQTTELYRVRCRGIAVFAR